MATATSGSIGGSDEKPSSSWTVSRAFTQAEVDAFVALTGDANPIHRRQGGSSSSAPQQPPPLMPLVPGLLLASLFPAIIGSRFSGALYARQTLRFRAPAHVGEPVVAEVSLAAKPAAGGGGGGSGGGGGGGGGAAAEGSLASSSSSRVAFDTVVRRADDGRVLVEGTALAIIPLKAQQGRR
jgi:acyl dehydratase